jgi:ribosome-associated toxin RatA of RatAB toxin-antitoxin module
MRTRLTELDVVAASARLPGVAETVEVPLGRSGPRGRGDRVDLPAFRCDPRLDPNLPARLRRRVDRFSAVAYLAVSDLLAGLEAADRPERDRVGVFFANTRAGWSYGEPELDLLVSEGLQAMHAYQATAWFPAAAQGEVTIALDLRGCAKTTAGGTSGFGEALWLARDALERGAIDLAIVGAAESLVNGFVLRDWAADQPLPVSGPAEGAVMFALRRPDPGGMNGGHPDGDHPDPGRRGSRRPVRLRELRHAAYSGEPEPDWVPTLSAASRLNRAIGRLGEDTAVSLGGGFWITVAHSVTATAREKPMHDVLSEVTPVGELAVEARHELVIPGPVADVFEMTRDVGRWTEYMPAVTSGVFVEQAADGDLVEITAEANEQTHTWRSRRAVDRTVWTIDFARVGAVEPLLRMEGRWQFTPLGEGTRAVLTHRYAATTAEALAFYTNATRSNATRDLQGLADYFSRKENTP